MDYIWIPWPPWLLLLEYMSRYFTTLPYLRNKYVVKEHRKPVSFLGSLNNCYQIFEELINEVGKTSLFFFPCGFRVIKITILAVFGRSFKSLAYTKVG